MLAALPRTAYGHPGIGAVVYLAIVAVLVGSRVVAARRNRGGGGDTRGGREGRGTRGGRGKGRGRRTRRPPHR